MVTYRFDKILIMLRGKMIMNYHEINESSNNILPESQRIMQKKIEKAKQLNIKIIKENEWYKLLDF